MGVTTSNETGFQKQLDKHPPAQMGIRQLVAIIQWGVEREYSEQTLKPLRDELKRRKFEKKSSSDTVISYTLKKKSPITE